MTNCKLGNLNTMNGGRSKRATRRLQKKRSVKPKKIRGGKRSVRARAGKKTRRNKAKRARKQRGGAKYLLEGGFSLSQAWNGFLYKKLMQKDSGMNDTDKDVIEFDKDDGNLPGGDREKKVLYIIDMQYDFMDEEFDDTIPGDGGDGGDGGKEVKFKKEIGGNFAVAEGKDLVAEKSGFLVWLKKNAPNFDKIYVSRDYHQKGHMSFYQGGNGKHANIGRNKNYDAPDIGQEGGQYPVHCLQGSKGAMLHKNLVDTLK